MLLMVWDIVPVGSIPTNNGDLQMKKNFEASSFKINNPAPGT